ncbi:uncharacterized protein LOC134184492 [Corticium candelabrum]|uniref:uncharacterized protein LOC134184492 n=1 Tax=Corticium candelabrum TaxID=121492 RepID=UPI002E354DBC|nr:uncharacterized protein LOC134184492 [Corticium candelabrum]
MPRAKNKRHILHPQAVQPTRSAGQRQRSGGLPARGTTGSVADNVLAKRAIVEALQKSYQTHERTVDAASMSKYMRNQFAFYGLRCPQRRELDRQVLSRQRSFDQGLLTSIATELWQKDQREFQYFVVDLLSKKVRDFVGSSSSHFKQASSCLLILLTTKSWWDTVDLLASGVVGPLVMKHGSVGIDLVEEWIQGDNMWLRRTALLHQLKYKEKTDSDRLFRFCLQCAHEEEVFIRKAIGWALREYHKVDPGAVERFVRRNASNLSALSKKEALKHT